MAKKILIVDDERKIRELIKATLVILSDDIEMHEAEDGNEALRVAREIMPDLIILDIMMPGASGYHVCKEIRKNPKTSKILVLFLTARGGELSEMTVELSGGNELMTKPFNPIELRMKVKNMLNI